MLHRAIFGSLERFIGILLEKLLRGPAVLAVTRAGPWSTTITSDADAYAAQVRRANLRAAGPCGPRPMCVTRKINYKVARATASRKFRSSSPPARREVAENTVAFAPLRPTGPVEPDARGPRSSKLRAEAAERGRPRGALPRRPAS